MTAEQIQRMRYEAQAAIERMKSEMSQGKDDQTPTASRPRSTGNERVHPAKVSKDGRWFFVGTSEGLRVYDWPCFPREPESDSPSPVWQFSALVGDDPISSEARIYAIAEEPGGRAIAFGGMDRKIYTMNLDDGLVRMVIELPTRGSITDMVFSKDGRALAVQSVVRSRRRKESLLPEGTTLEVWDYAKLLESALFIS